MESIIEKNDPQPNDCMLAQLQLVTGIWVDGKTYWLNNYNEKIITTENITVKVKQENVHSKVRISHIYMTNHKGTEKKVKLILMHRYVQASKDHFTFISPSEQVIFHLANKKVFLVNGQFEGQGIQQTTIQPFWTINTDKMWNCIEKGVLRYQPMAKGLAVSIFTLDITIPSNETKKATTWTIQGETKSELAKVNKTLLKNTLAFPFKK